MKQSTMARLTKELLIATVLGSVAISLAADKQIRLRTETIRTPDTRQAPGAPAPAGGGDAVPGLFLIQFEDRLQPEWKASLRAAGVELVRYVPEDAFVARCDHARVHAVRALPFVRWVGPFRPDHKIHPRLQRQAQGRAAHEPIALSVLLSPLATPAETGEAQRLLPGASRSAVPRLGTILRGQMPAGQLAALAQSAGVLWLEPAPQMTLSDEVSSRIVAGDGPGHATAMMQLGYDGTGVTVAVADSGLDSGELDFLHPDIAGRVRAFMAYGGLEDASDEHGHGTHAAGIIAGNGATGEIDENDYLYGLGVAPGAGLVAQRLFDGAGAYYPPPTFETLTREARQAGAEIGSNSWGDDTHSTYDLSAAEFDALVRDADLLTPGDQPYILEFSAGNTGPGAQTINSPAVGKNVIATGASQNDRFNLPIEEFSLYGDGREAMADFSSRGPCEDGRIKPDVVAPGTWIASLRSVYANDENAWWPISDNYFYMSGTSMAGPQVSGAAAVFVHYFRVNHTNTTPSPALVKAALIHSATDLDDGWGTGPTPNMDEGWGRVDLPQLIGGSVAPEYLDQAVPLAQGQVFEHRVVLDNDTLPFKVTLAYTDVPGFPGSPIALVNDLDLEVVGPDGLLYRGNQFEQGESVPNAPGADSLNNVEGVYLAVPRPGEYVVRVRARQVVEDARADTPADDQDFALVISASIAPPGNGILTFDRPAYTVPGLIRLTLVDHNLAGQPTATVQLRSSTEPAGETLTLRASGVTGLFTASVATVTGPAGVDGRLQVTHGDTIEAIYIDTAPPATRVFTVRADLQPPAIADVAATNRFGRTYISFTTDEDAVSSVRYGTNTLDFWATNRVFDTFHELALTNVLPNLPYQFRVVAEDFAGNRATNEFTYTAAGTATVLLVDAYTDSLFSVPPLTGYTEALDRLGVSYQVFDATGGISPTAEELRPYRCVLWRFPEFHFSDLGEITITSADVQAITNYLAGGGSLLVASMELLSRLPADGFPNFARDWLQVGSFTEDTQVGRVAGASGDPMGTGIDTLLNYVEYDDPFKEFMQMPPDVSDTITPTTNAAPVFYDGFEVCGVRSPKPGVDLPGRVVFLSFPLDAVPLGTGVGNNRAGLLGNILNFLAPAEGTSTLTLDSDRYTVPGVAVVEVEDRALDGQGATTVTFSSPHHPGGLAVVLTETVRRGLFRGSVALVPAGGSSSGPALVVQAGDTLRADYPAAPAEASSSASAVIETTPPVITGLGWQADYVAAYIWWDTSEPADALVQFSDSKETLAPTNSLPINATAYDPTLDTTHVLLLENLLPNHTYYFRVVSRDKAGNVVVDDNQTNYYSFTTLEPVSLPWSEDFEAGVGEWTVIPVEGSESDWTLGTPGGGASAHSPPSCWGSNLDGGQIGLAESVLISPGIFLAGGNDAKLRFWHNYEFLSADTEFEFGELWLITNATTGAYVPLDAIGTFLGGDSDSSGGWILAEYDLTPYLGTVVYVAWHYFLYGDDLERQGWLVDDVSVVVGQTGRGTVQVSVNLAQAFLVVNGPVSRSGPGPTLVISNAPPGQYTVQFGAVPYYDLPPSQTQTLEVSNVLAFQAYYVFNDSNLNGISDLWEQQYFGSAAPGHLASFDSDGDGVSDYAEFTAGTNPTNGLSVLRATLSPATNGVAQLSWKAAGQRAYRVLASDDLVTWDPATDWLHAPRTSVRLPVTIGPDAHVRYYRLEVQP